MKKVPSRIVSYDKYLLPEYQAEVFKLYVIYIKEIAESAGNRKEYRSVCYVIKDLEEIGGRKDAEELIAFLKQEYNGRPAFVDELGKID